MDKKCFACGKIKETMDKKCFACGKIKDTSEFCTTTQGYGETPDGLKHFCIDCAQSYPSRSRAWRKGNK